MKTEVLIISGLSCNSIMYTENKSLTSQKLVHIYLYANTMVLNYLWEFTDFTILPKHLVVLNT